MEELLKQIGIEPNLTKSDEGSYIMDISDSTEYGKIYSKLDRSDLVQEEALSSQVTYDTSSIQYTADKYIITLLADFKQDEYKLTIRLRR